MCGSFAKYVLSYAYFRLVRTGVPLRLARGAMVPRFSLYT